MTPRITCTRRVEFDAGHRVAGHEHACRFVHGHRYIVEATFEAETLDALGRVIDFGSIRETLGGWINQHWDHTLILWERDRALGEAVAAHTGQTVFYLPANPTAENLASYLLNTVCPELFGQGDARCVAVRVTETPNCWAEVAG